MARGHPYVLREVVVDASQGEHRPAGGFPCSWAAVHAPLQQILPAAVVTVIIEHPTAGKQYTGILVSCNRCYRSVVNKCVTRQASSGYAHHTQAVLWKKTIKRKTSSRSVGLQWLNKCSVSLSMGETDKLIQTYHITHL